MKIKIVIKGGGTTDEVAAALRSVADSLSDLTRDDLSGVVTWEDATLLTEISKPA